MLHNHKVVYLQGSHSNNKLFTSCF